MCTLIHGICFKWIYYHFKSDFGQINVTDARQNLKKIKWNKKILPTIYIGYFIKINIKMCYMNIWTHVLCKMDKFAVHSIKIACFSTLWHLIDFEVQNFMFSFNSFFYQKKAGFVKYACTYTKEIFTILINNYMYTIFSLSVHD